VATLPGTVSVLLKDTSSKIATETFLMTKVTLHFNNKYMGGNASDLGIFREGNPVSGDIRTCLVDVARCLVS
jgi:hypothetical protein